MKKPFDICVSNREFLLGIKLQTNVLQIRKRFYRDILKNQCHPLICMSFFDMSDQLLPMKDIVILSE